MFEVGHIKTGGRKRGTPNLITRDIRLLLKELVNDEISTLSERLQLMTPEERTAILIKLLPYVLPIVERTPHDINEPIIFD